MIPNVKGGGIMHNSNRMSTRYGGKMIICFRNYVRIWTSFAPWPIPEN
jgi:hypothetical protein